MKIRDWLGIVFVLGIIALLILSEKPAVEPILHDNTIVDTTGYIAGTAYVEDIQLMLLESFPVQVRAVITGTVSDGCTVISGVSEKREGQTFTLDVVAKRPPDLVCTQALEPFEEQVGLAVSGLLAGTYRVVAGDVVRTFTLDVDNILSNEMIPQPGPEIETIDTLPPAGVLVPN